VSRTRREVLFAGLGVAAAAPLSATAAAARTEQRQSGSDCARGSTEPRWAAGVEGQRRADLGNGFYLNPVLAGDHPDPSILRDGEVYYEVSSSFVYYPGLVIWQSQDLVSWSPVGPALNEFVGSVYAPDFVKHDGRYYIYFAARSLPQPEGAAAAPQAPKRRVITTYVVHADSISGPWSDPVDVGIYDAIDPGHVVGEDGKRYLFMSGGGLVPISDDGLKRVGPTETVYKGWDYPGDWVVEGFYLEGPKLLRRDGWFYLFSAEGGTAGPPTSHMVVVARARSVRGPWENCPHNPIVRTTAAGEPWWSRGHATPVEGPRGDWWLVYHGYENSFRTLGRQMLLEPIEWTSEGWPKAQGGDLAKPIRKPSGGKPGPHGVAFSGDFSMEAFRGRLAFFKPLPDYLRRVSLEAGALILPGQGAGPSSTSPLVINAGDRSYEVSVELELRGSARGGLLLFYDEKFFCGLASDLQHFRSYKMGNPPFVPAIPAIGANLFLRLANEKNIASFFYSRDGKLWTLHSSFEVSGYNHNVADGFFSLRPAIFAAGDGSVAFRSISYIARS
jgi:xylan 1,4-beta-xylosidase